MRLTIFKRNLQLIEDLNRYEQGTAKYGVTEFADLTNDEFKQRTGLVRDFGDDNRIKNPIAEIPNVEIPKSFDWREKNAVSDVKDQGQCGSCWAFSVTGNIEGLHAVKSGKLEQYSEQELLDCDTVDSACNGGEMTKTYELVFYFFISNSILIKMFLVDKSRKLEAWSLNRSIHTKLKSSNVTLTNPLFMSRSKELSICQRMKPQWLNGWFLTVQSQLVSGLKLQKPTFSNYCFSGLNANAMQFYRGGISHPWKFLCRSSSLDHGVLIVGLGVSEYPTLNKTLPYWIVKNSWGKKWGEQGYYRIYRGENACGVREMATSAVLAD